jgi:hypothetical protein
MKLSLVSNCEWTSLAASFETRYTRMGRWKGLTRCRSVKRAGVPAVRTVTRSPGFVVVGSNRKKSAAGAFSAAAADPKAAARTTAVTRRRRRAAMAG